ncbi:hypothetical protein WT60_05920 [Burkholderia sp. MSMB617WGS]|nr:hypothetical protein WT60_05920 [Burkholderia sp. MSMB617WGS]KWZ45490.1 hypothetical protein WS73_15085 [Burkholderia savannae]
MRRAAEHAARRATGGPTWPGKPRRRSFGQPPHSRAARRARASSIAASPLGRTRSAAAPRGRVVRLHAPGTRAPSVHRATRVARIAALPT